ncbi:hypothetical protein N8364_00910 [Saprospiraceae bacterium]|nr:hypothetical protein [Saprospiraceae bacterium]MDC1508207.1 hypothetical protein [Saprospiraceae bacterium]
MKSIFTLLLKLYKYLRIARRNNWNYQLLFACDIYIPAIPATTRIGHPVGIVMSDLAKLGDNCTILQNVTIAQKNGKAPTIGNYVYLGAGCIILGDITIGDNVTIGAGAIITKSVPSNSIVYNKVETIIKNKDSVS